MRAGADRVGAKRRIDKNVGNKTVRDSVADAPANFPPAEVWNRRCWNGPEAGHCHVQAAGIFEGVRPSDINGSFDAGANETRELSAKRNNIRLVDATGILSGEWIAVVGVLAIGAHDLPAMRQAGSRA